MNVNHERAHAYIAALSCSNQKAIQTLRDENVTYWGDDIIVL